MMPKTRVSPAASRNSMMPSCRPLRVCSRSRVMRRRRGGVDLQLALRGVEIAVLGQHTFLGAQHELSGFILFRAHAVPVLDRVLAGAEAERAAYAVEFCRA